MQYYPYPLEQNPFSSDDHKLAKLKLDILKRNFQYIRFFEELNKDPYRVCPELRLVNENDDEYQRRTGVLFAQGTPLFGNKAEHFNVNAHFIVEVQTRGAVPTSKILILLNPKNDIEDVSCPNLIKMLPILFLSFGVTEWGRARGIVEKLDGSMGYQHFHTKVTIDLRRYEKLLKIDLRTRKSELLKEFERFIQYEQDLLAAGKKFNLSTYDWEIDDKRIREEHWDQLKVWDLRKKKKSFWWIAKELDISEDLAKKRFYRAYELTQWKKFDPNLFQKEGWVVSLNDLSKICDNCLTRETCMEACPEIMPFIDQDQVSLREKLLDPSFQ